MDDDAQETTTSTEVAGRDLISELSDDLLLQILSFLPAASKVARTTVLSRRWRHLWSNAVSLRFSIGRAPKWYDELDDVDDACRLIDAASAVLERRAAGGGPDVKDVEVSFIYSAEDNEYIEALSYVGYSYYHLHGAYVTSAHLATWLSFGASHVTRRFTLAVPVMGKAKEEEEEEEEEEGGGGGGGGGGEEEPVVAEEVLMEEAMAVSGADEEEEPVMDYDNNNHDVEVDEDDDHSEDLEVDDGNDDDDDDDNATEEGNNILFAELPGSSRVHEMSLTLGRAILKVPTTGSFHALTDLLLSHARFNPGGGDDIRLGHLLSSSCSPHLRTLQIGYISGLSTLRLASSSLQELRLLGLHNMKMLEVNAPALRTLTFDETYHRIKEARISAPLLEVLGCGFIGHAEELQFDGAASLRRIDDLHFYSHRLPRDHGADNSAAMWFLRHCTVVDQLDVNLFLSIWPLENIYEEEMADYKDMMVDVPALPNVISLTIKIDSVFGHGHTVGATLAKLIAKCARIEYLSIDIRVMPEECSDPSCICGHPKGWDRQKMWLQHLRIVEIHDNCLLDSHMRLLKLFLANAPALERMTVTFKPDVSFVKDIGDANFDVLPCCGGRWAPSVWECSEIGFVSPIAYEWTPLTTQRGEQGKED